MRVEISQQVADFLRRQAPARRQMLRRALEELSRNKELLRNKGEIRSLEGPLDEYCRLRVQGDSIIFSYTSRGTIECVFAERRSIVYEIFAQALVDKLVGIDE